MNPTVLVCLDENQKTQYNVASKRVESVAIIDFVDSEGHLGRSPCLHIKHAKQKDHAKFLHVKKIRFGAKHLANISKASAYSRT